MVRRTASLYRPGAATYFRLYREPVVVRLLLQHEPGEPQGIQIVLGFGNTQMEGQVRVPGSDEYRSRWRASVHVLSSRARSGIYQALVRRHAAGVWPRSSADHGLAGARKICAVHWLSRVDKGKESGATSGRAR